MFQFKPTDSAYTSTRYHFIFLLKQNITVLISFIRPLKVALVFIAALALFIRCNNPSGNQVDGFSPSELQIRSFNVSPDTLELFDSEAELVSTNFSIQATFDAPERLEFPLYAYIQDVVSSEIYGSFTIAPRNLSAFNLNFEAEVELPKAGFLELSVVLQAPIVNGQQLRAEKRVIAQSGENTPPEILEIAYPDTAQIPATGQNPVGFFARATDPQGLNDVQGVYMDIFTKSTMNFEGQLVMLDNGDPANGDQTARDGIFTTVVGLTPTSTPRTFLLYFYALDRQGLSSDTTITEFTTIR